MCSRLLISNGFLCTMTSLSGESLPAQCIFHIVLVKMLCRHYPMLISLGFVGVSQELAVSQNGYMTRRKFGQNFTAHNPSV